MLVLPQSLITLMGPWLPGAPSQRPTGAGTGRSVRAHGAREGAAVSQALRAGGIPRGREGANGCDGRSTGQSSVTWSLTRPNARFSLRDRGTPGTSVNRESSGRSCPAGRGLGAGWQQIEGSQR